jgi:hypothetical protein
MNNSYVKESFSYWAEHPEDTSVTDISHLEEATQQFPYCQSLYILMAKSLSVHQPENIDSQIQKAAAYALSRNALRKLIQNEFEWSPSLQKRQFDNVLIWPNDPEAKESPSFGPPKWKLPTLSNIGFLEEIKAISEEITAKTMLPERPPIDDTTLRESALQTELEQIDSSQDISEGQRELERRQQMAIIDSFIENEAKLGPIRANLQDFASNTEQEDLAKKRNASFQGTIASEGMAKIMARQGKIERAIEIYEQLMLKKPQKKAYFAEKIKELTME